MADRTCIAIIEDENILMIRQTYRGQTLWTFPGGSIEPGETPEAAAIREAREEVCIDVEIIEQLCRVPRTTSSGTYYCYLGRIVEGQPTIGNDPELPPEAQELHELGWFPLHQVRDHPEVSRIWTALVSHIRGTIQLDRREDRRPHSIPKR